MFKELFLAILFGVLIGFGGAGTFFALKKINKDQNISKPLITNISPSQNNPLPSPREEAITNQSRLEIESPQNSAIVSTASINITGSFVKNSLIIATTFSRIYQTTTTDSGAFSLPINLETGANDIKITGITNDYQIDTQLLITYSTSKIE